MGRGVGERAEAESFKVPCSHSGSAINWLFVLVPFYHLFKKKKKNKQTEYILVKFTGKQKLFYKGPDNTSFVDHIEFVLHILVCVCVCVF